MSVNPALQLALWLADATMAVIPRSKPSADALEACRIVSHRGEHDNRSIFENTMKAFHLAHRAGAWGLEMDVRWTRDLVPVVHHDVDTRRVFGVDLKLSDTDFDSLRELVPEIPTLGEFISEFGGETHLMIELKAEAFPELEKQKASLRDHLSGLKPIQDYHFLALDPELFEVFEIEPRKACLPVATLNAKALSAVALERGYAGISGHFLMLGDAMKQRHDAAGQLFGTGFPTSKNCLYRELNRGVRYVFTNDAVKLLGVLDKEKTRTRV